MAERRYGKGPAAVVVEVVHGARRNRSVGALETLDHKGLRSTVEEVGDQHRNAGADGCCHRMDAAGGKVVPGMTEGEVRGHDRV